MSAFTHPPKKTNTLQSWAQEHRNENKINRNTLDENSLNLQILRLKAC